MAMQKVREASKTGNLAQTSSTDGSSRLLTPEHPIRFEARALALLDAQRHVKVLSGESRNAPGAAQFDLVPHRLASSVPGVGIDVPVSIAGGSARRSPRSAGPPPVLRPGLYRPGRPVAQPWA
jgi:hypothetical protein